MRVGGNLYNKTYSRKSTTATLHRIFVGNEIFAKRLRHSVRDGETGDKLFTGLWLAIAWTIPLDTP